MNCAIEYGFLCFKDTDYFLLWLIGQCALWSIVGVYLYRRYKCHQRNRRTWDRRFRGLP